MEIGIIGLGAMGREIARNLVAAGYTVTAWNRFANSTIGMKNDWMLCREERFQNFRFLLP